MGLSTMFLALLFLAILFWLGRRSARRHRTETPEQRERRIRNENETAAAMSITEDH